MNEKIAFILVISTFASIIFGIISYAISSYISKKELDALHKRIMEKIK